MGDVQEPKSAADGHFKSYKGFATSITTWFVAYGIGTPMVALSNEKILGAFLLSEYWMLIAACFFVGIVLQIWYAFRFKHLQWNLYLGEIDESHKAKEVYTKALKKSEQYWFDNFVQYGTVISYFTGTVLLLMETQKYSFG